MTDERSIVLRLPSVISDYFLMEQCCAHTFSARAYKALDKANRVSVGLWVSREPVESSRSLQLAKRMEALRSRAGISEIRSCGVDAHGVAFVAISNLDGFKIAAEPADMRERQRRFFMCLKAVERVHSAGLVCGDLCADSFFVDRSGAVRFIGVMGDLSPTKQLFQDELQHLLPYRHSEFSSSAPKAVDDLYALFVLGYRLFSGAYPERSAGAVTPLRQIKPDVPIWVDELLVPLLNRGREEIPNSAGTFLEQLKIYKEDELFAQLAPQPIVVQQKAPLAGDSEVVQVRLAAPIGEARSEHSSVGKKHEVVGRPQYVGTLIILLVFFLSFFMEGRTVVVWINEWIAGPGIADIHPEDVSVTISSDGTLQERQEQLKVVFASEDPVAHDTLLRRLQLIKDRPERDFLISGLLERSRRMGLSLSAAETRRWVQDLALMQPADPMRGGVARKNAVLTEEQVLKVVDPLLPTLLRIELLEACYERDPGHTAMMAAALSLDMGQMESYSRFVSRYAKESLSVADAEKHSFLSLLFLLPEFALSHAALLKEQIPHIPDQDLIWLLKEVVSRNVTGAAEISSQLVSRQLVTGLQVLYLKELGGVTPMPSAVELALVSSAVSGPTREDVVAFSKWYSPTAVNILFLVVLTAKDATLAGLAFDTVLSKPVLNPSLAELVENIRSAPQLDRGQAGRVAAALAVESKLSDQDLSQILRGLRLEGAMRPMIDVVFRSSSHRVINELLRQYSLQLGSSLIQVVLQHPNPVVRLQAVELLALSNDRAAQREALDLYLKEENADVIAAYKRLLRFEEAASKR